MACSTIGTTTCYVFWHLQHPLGTFARYWQNGLAPLDQRYLKRDFKTWTPESSLSSTPTPESIRLPTPTPETVGWTTRHTPQLKQHVTRCLIYLGYKQLYMEMGWHLVMIVYYMLLGYLKYLLGFYGHILVGNPRTSHGGQRKSSNWRILIIATFDQRADDLLTIVGKFRVYLVYIF